MDGTNGTIDLGLGYVNLRLPDMSGEYTEQRIDLLVFTMKLMEAGKERADAGDHAGAAKDRAEWLRQQEFGNVSPLVATMALDRLWAEMTLLQKKTLSSGSVGTPGPSGSRPST